jgi:hypothetical protein
MKFLDKDIEWFENFFGIPWYGAFLLMPVAIIGSLGILRIIFINGGLRDRWVGDMSNPEDWRKYNTKMRVFFLVGGVVLSNILLFVPLFIFKGIHFLVDK